MASELGASCRGATRGVQWLRDSRGMLAFFVMLLRRGGGGRYFEHLRGLERYLERYLDIFS